eukprot:jgi/Ulvmu1/9160/UM005_0258.1
MARLQLSGGARDFYENTLGSSDDEAEPITGTNASTGPQSARRKERVRQKSAPQSQSSDPKVQRDSVPAPDVPKRASASPGQDDNVANEDGVVSGSASSGSDQGSDESYTSSTGDDTDVASDLEGLQVASAVGNIKPPGKQKVKAMSSSQAITEAGVASKLGVAFSRVLERSSKQEIMQGSKSVQKRRREEEAETAQNKLAKQERRERRKRGHVAVPLKGQDPVHDAREKTLVSVATKGVVQLFNAISKAQSAKRQADAAGAKPRDVVKSTKAALLSALKPDAQPADSETPRWKVLQQGFTGMHEAGKLKDLDREGSSDGDGDADEVDDQEESDGIDEW